MLPFRLCTVLAAAFLLANNPSIAAEIQRDREAQMHVIEALQKLFAENPTKKEGLKKLRDLGQWAAGGGINGE